MRDVLNRAIKGRDQGHDPAGGAARPVWPWAAASIAMVVLVLGGTLLVHTLLLANQQPTVVPAPSLAPMAAVAVAHPEAGARLVALDAGNGHLLALAVPREQTCPPTGTCPAAPAPDAFVVLDGRSGQPLAATPLTGDAATATGARQLVVDAGRHLAYAVAPRAVTIFSTDSGARVGGYALPVELADGLGAALDADGGLLYLADLRQAFLVRASSGQVLATQDVISGTDATLLDGPILDGARSRIYLLLRTAAGPTEPQLLVYDAHDLQQLQQISLPAGARLGPPDAGGANLYVFGRDGTTWTLPLDVLAYLSNLGSPPRLTAVPALHNALALGENRTLGHQYVADANMTRAIGAEGALAALPLPAHWAPSLPLPLDESRGLLYLPADHGAIVIVQDGAGTPGSGKTALSSTTATILARAGFASVWHDTEPADGPAFASVAMFPIQPGARAQDFWQRDPSHGWQGPYAGQASTAVAAGPTAGSFRVTFTLTWNQLFVHQHTWSWEVSPDGAARLVASTGDVVP